ncbi:MAG TPA: polysaccharide biosynthesis/export family protein [Verrucomicrobiae bacterium]
MSEEYTHVGTVRRRPRNGHQRSQNSSGNGEARSGSNGSYARNGNGRHDRQERQDRDSRREFDRESYFDRDPGEAREQRRSRSRFGMGAKKEEKKPASTYGSELDEEPLFRFPFDPWRLYGAVKRNLGWIAVAAMLLGVAGFFFALFVVDYKINVNLIRTTSNAMRVENAPVVQWTPREYSEPTLYAFMKSSDVINRVVEKAAANPQLAPLQITPKQLAESISFKPTPNPDFIQMSMTAFGPIPAMVELANMYGREVTAYTKEIQTREAKLVNKLLQDQIGRMNEQKNVLTTELRKFSESGFVDYGREMEAEVANLTKLRIELDERKLELERVNAQIGALGGTSGAPTTKLAQAQEELRQLLISKKEAHPEVQQKRVEIKRLEQLPDGGGPATGSAVGANPLALVMADWQGDEKSLQRRITDLTERIAGTQQRLMAAGRITKDVEFQIKSAQMRQLEKSLDELSDKERESREFIDGSRGYFALHGEATSNSVGYKNRWMKVGLLAVFAGLIGLLGAMAIVMLTEMLDTTIRTPEDITRVTQLPVLATLGDLRKMSAAQQVNWAFRTLTLLKGKLAKDADEALVCGIISANHGEGRSTWVNLLVSAASQRGLRVLTVDTKAAAVAPAPAPSPGPTPPVETNGAKTSGAAKDSSSENGADDTSMNAENNVLSTPAKVAEQLENNQALVHIPLPGWVWSLERRKQWQNALECWKDIDNLVIFVELPPACEQEAILLAEQLPQCLWLAGSGMADATETAAHIETLRHARCNLVGAVLNHAPPPFLSSKITRWFNKSTAAVLLACSLLHSNVAAENEAESVAQAQFAAGQNAEQPKATFSASKRQRAKWQEKLTLGPGDVIDIHFYGNSALSRTNVLIGPDGRLTYLQANGLNAAGLSIEELRQRLDESLGEFYTAPRTIVVPVAFNSKKYFVLGKVNAKGAYPLDRPLTLVEAVGRAKGLETGLYQRTTVEMADLGRSFIVRGNEKLNVDFERLFLEGDLSQNIQIEPNDYIFFASTGAKDIYVLGEVVNPGPLGFVSDASVITAIADRGGFNEKAFKKRVLVVRGSLAEPETFVVDTASTVEAAVRDFRLQARDIVYVSRRPWLKAEELLDEAATSFIQGAVTTWAGVNVGPIITSRWFPRARPTTNE